jgi:chemotaxis protein methyltransferase CheR
MELTAEQFSKLSKLVYKKLGLQFDDKKLYFLNKRVERRMTVLQLQSADEYLFQLGYCDTNGEEMQALANLITTNETYMFREFEQLAGFADVCLPELIAAKQKTTDRRIRIWCAGCSSGEEAYTLAIIIREVFPDSANWDIQIVATDIDENVLQLARHAVYGDRSVKFVPAAYSKHLIPAATGFRIDPDTARLVIVKKLNLNDAEQMRAMRGFDFVFCRNVLIYFDDVSQRNVVNHLYNSLNAKGYIFLGHSESVGRITSAFHLKKIEGHLLYRKD